MSTIKRAMRRFFSTFIIYGVRSNAQLPISDKAKLNAARKRKEIITDMERKNKGVKIDHEICVSFRDCTIPLEEEQESQCQYYIYDRKWIANNKDYPTLLNNFIYLFGFADREMRIPLVSKKSEIPILMEKIIIGEALLILGVMIGVNVYVYIVHPMLEARRKQKIDLIRLESIYLVVIKKPDRTVEYMILTQEETALIGGSDENKGL